MRVRAMDANNDMTFGQGAANFYVNSPQAVAQIIKTRLLLFLGEWFLDTSQGTPWYSQVLGAGTQTTRDRAIRNRILQTPGVSSITGYNSQFNPTTRNFSVRIASSVKTVYGVTDAVVVLTVNPPSPLSTLPPAPPQEVSPWDPAYSADFGKGP